MLLLLLLTPCQQLAQMHVHQADMPCGYCLASTHTTPREAVPALMGISSHVTCHAHHIHHILPQTSTTTNNTTPRWPRTETQRESICKGGMGRAGQGQGHKVRRSFIRMYPTYFLTYPARRHCQTQKTRLIGRIFRVQHLALTVPPILGTRDDH